MSGDVVDLTVSANLRDQFDAVSYGNNDGTAVWSSGWIEGNDSGSPSNGNIRIEGGALHLDNQDGGSLEFITRSADLSDAATAVLTFDYAGYGAGGLDTVVAEISADGGGTWTLLERMDIVGSESGSRSYNLESYTDLSADLQLRFRIAQGFEGSGQHISFDNVDIAYSGTGIGGSSSVSTATASSSITVTPVNDAAIFSGDTAGSGNEDGVISGTLSVSDTADGMTTPNYTVSTDGTNGTATIDAAGNWSYTPNANWSGTDSFTVSVTDDDGNTESQTISITVNAVTDLTATADSFSVEEDNTLSDTVAANDSTTSGGALSYALDTGVSNGSLTFNADGSFAYTPTANYNGSDSFTYTVTDAASGESTTQTVSITVTPVNDSPVAGDDSITVVEDTPFTSTIDLDANDTDVDGDALILVAGTFATTQGGTIVIAADGTYTYTPPANFNGTDSVDYTVTDGSLTDVGTLTITVTAVNDAPVLLTGSVNNLTLSEDASLTSLGLESVTYGTGGGSDESSQSLTYEVTVIPSPTSGDIFLVDGTTRVTTGIYTLAQIQGMQFKPADNWNGTTGFQFNVSDTGGTANGGSDSISQFISITVEPVNDAPIVDLNGSDGAGSGFTTTFTEGGGAVLVVDSDAIVTDIDSTAYNALSINFLTAPDGANEKLIVGGYTFSHGASDVATRTVGSTVFEIDFDGTGFSIARDGGGVIPDADLESLIRGISYENTSENPTSGSRTIEFVAVDDQGLISLASNSSVSVTPTNDNPVVNNLDGDVLNYSEGDGTVILDQGNDSVVSDVDSANFEGGSLNIECDSGLQATEDVFAIRNQGTGAGQIGVSVNDVTYGGIVIGTFSGGTGLAPLNIVFNSNATSAAVSALLQNITYENTDNDNPTEGTRSITIDLTDGDGGAIVTQNMTVNVSAVNDVPTTSGLANQTLAEDFADYTIDLKAIFADVETSDANLIYTVSGNSNIGVSIDVNGVATISSSANRHGSETLTFTATDEGGASVDATADFIVNPVNDAAVFSGDTAGSGNEDTTIAGTLSVSDTADGMSTPNYTVTTDGTNGTATIDAAGNWTYTPTANWSGTDSFTVSVTDDDGNVESQIISITVNPVVDLTATDDSFSVDEDTTLSDTVAANDSTTSGGALSYTLNTDVTNGSLTLNADGSFSYTPTVNYNGSDSFTYTVTDAASGESATQTVSITINQINDNAIFSGDTAGSGNEDSVISGTLSVTDSADGMSTPNFTVSTDGTNGTATINATTGEWNYTPTANWSGSDSFTVSVTDDDGNVESQIISITVNPVGDLTATNDSFSVDEDTTLSDTVAANDSTTSGGALSYTLNTDVTNGSLTLNADGSFSYTPNSNYNGSDSFTYTVTDLTSGESATQTVTISVNQINDNAVFSGDTAGSGNEDTTIAGTLSVSDTADGMSTPNYTVTTDGTNGTATIDASGNWSYTPTANWSGTDSFTVSVTDDDGNVETQIISITVNPVGDLTATDDSFTIAEDTPLSDTVAANDSTTSGGTLSYALDTDVSSGSLTFNADGSFSYTPAANFNGTDSFTYTVTDAASGESATQTVAITVNPVNDEQILATNTGASVAEGSTGNVVTTAMLATTDVDNSSDQLVYTVDSAPANGTLYDNGVALTVGGSFTQADIDAGLITYDHDGSQTSSDAFAFTVDDGAGTTTSGSFSWSVSNTNDAPTAANNTVTTAEDTTHTFTAADFNFSDVDGDTLTSVQITSLESVGSLQLNGVDVSLNQVITKADIDAGLLRFTPAADANGTGYDSFGFTVNDGITDSVSSHTMTVDVTAVNDTPTVETTLADQTLAEDFATYTIDLTAAFADIETSDANLSYTVAGNSNIGVSIDLNGIATISSTANWHGSETLTFTATDEGGLSVSQDVIFTVTPVNDAAVFSGDTSGSGNEDTVIGGTLTVSDTADGMTTPNYTVTTDGTNGTATINATTGEWNYTPTANWSGADSFTVSVTDDDGNTETQIISITVNPVGDLTATDDSFTIAEDTPLSDTVAANDSTTSGGTLSYALDTDVSSGGLTFNADGSFSYTPAANFNGTDSFTYTVTDAASGESATATVTLTITPVNDAPTFDSTALTTATEDVAYSYTITTSDSDGDALTIDATTLPSWLTLTDNGDGTATLAGTPTNAEVGDHSVILEASDGSLSATQSFTISVSNTNDAPLAVDDSITVAEDTPYTSTIDLDANDTDVDGDALSVVAGTFATTQGGTIVIAADGSYTYTPAANFNGTDTVDYTVTDGSLTDVGTLTITVAAVNDPPLAVDNAVSGNEDTVITDNLLANDTDIEADALTANLLNGPAHGHLMLNADGSFSYTPDADWNGTDSFTYTVNDGALNSNVATVTITVNPVDDTVSDDGGTATVPDPIFEEPGTDQGEDPGVEVQTNEDPADDPVVEDEQTPTIVESLTPRDSADANEQLVNKEDPETEEAEEIIYLTDEIETDIQSEGREDDFSLIYFDNDLYKDLSIPKYLAISYAAADEPILESGNDFSILDFDSNEPNRADLNSDYDLHRQEIDESFNTELKSQEIKAKIVTISAATFAAGVVSYLLRVGSMVSSLMSTLPIWRGFDPIAIFSGNKKRKKDRNEMQNTNEPKSETLFDGDTE